MSTPKIEAVYRSKDGSSKYAVSFPNGTVVETVAIIDERDASGRDRISNVDPEMGFTGDGDGSGYDGRLTVCVSSQSGCPMECSFCATGKTGFIRDLKSDEIVSQVALVSKDLDTRASNVVFMGQGEPFLNYDEVLSAMRRINKDKGLGIGARHITVSTSGIVDRIYDFAEEPEQFRLAISLHSADQKTRNELMPRLSGQPIHSLKKALKYYSDVKGRRITIEYLLLEGVNDDPDQMQKLIEFCKDINAHVNFLTFNEFDGTEYKHSSKEVVDEWITALQHSGTPATLRRSKGADIAGACGQLARSYK